MRRRTIQSELEALASEFPVVSIYGPRQSGKTTLARMTFPDKPWVSLEDPDTRSRALHDARGFLASFPNGAVFDEIQRVPELLSYLQGVVDADRRLGRFILTGSHQAQLKKGVAQSLAGRTAVLTLLPYSLEECPNAIAAGKSVFDAIRRGFYPQLCETAIREKSFFPAYVATYLERDLPSLLDVRNLSVFQDFLFLLASRTGQLVNANAMSADLGVSAPTIRAWIAALAESNIVVLLRGWSRNAVRQVVKTPKVYFTDTGLACWLARLGDTDRVEGGPMRGGLYENFVIVDLLKRALNRSSSDRFWFYRDAKGHEVDLVIERDGRLIPIEIKSSATFTPDFTSGIRHFRSVFPDVAASGFVFFNGDPGAKDVCDGARLVNPVKGCPVYAAG
ncbi:MAG: ATP-binding protein [Planctomycetes bacterium]|nr:ATP-binding protein [Planctomycetota bacterium]